LISLQALGLLRAAGPCPPAIHAPDHRRIPPGRRPGSRMHASAPSIPSGHWLSRASRRSAPAVGASGGRSGRALSGVPRPVLSEPRT